MLLIADLSTVPHAVYLPGLTPSSDSLCEWLVDSAVVLVHTQRLSLQGIQPGLKLQSDKSAANLPGQIIYRGYVLTPPTPSVFTPLFPMHFLLTLQERVGCTIFKRPLC